MEEKIILVDGDDREVGIMEKMEAHREGKLHRAFSIFVFNRQEQLLLQKRAKTKYHSGGLWTNTCCSHPRKGESLEEAAHRRLKEEMGFDCRLEEVFRFAYRVEFDNGIIENELDHVFVGRFDGVPVPNPSEADDWKWVSIDELRKDIKKNPSNYTYWFRIAVEKVISGL